MGKKICRIAASLGGALSVAAPAQAIDLLDGQLAVTGFLRGQTAYSLENENPANTALGLPDSQDFNLFRALLVTDLDYKPALAAGGLVDEFRLFGRVRAHWVPSDSELGDYDAFPLSYDGDWTLMRVDTDEAALELWEAFADVRAGDAWFRLGRQVIVWGEADAIRLLDLVNPLDLTNHLFIEGGGEQFDHIRIPVWAVRGTYNFRSLPGYSVDAFVIPGDYVPTANPDRGSPLNLLPFPDNAPPTILPVDPFFIPGLRVEDDTNDRRGDIEGGIRLLGEVSGFQFTLNYLNKIDQDGVIIFDRFDPVAGQVVLRNHRDRLDIYGASFNWFAPPLGAVIRGELTYTPDQPYANNTPAGGTAIIERATTRFVLGFDRPTFVFPTETAMTISLQWFQTIREGDENDITILNAPADKDETNFSVFLSQPLQGNRFAFEFLGVLDTDDAYWWQPQVRYSPDDHWRLAVYANLFSGSELRPGRFGSLKFADEINLAISYQF